MDDYELIDKSIEEGKDAQFILNCLSCIEVSFDKAIGRGCNHIVKFMIDRGYDFKKNNESALKWAVQNGNLEVVKLLVGGGSDIHIFDDFPLLLACLGKKWDSTIEIIQFLIESGANTGLVRNRLTKREGHVCLLGMKRLEAAGLEW